MSAFIQPNTHVVLRLPSDALKVVEIIPNSSISIGKYGSFPANLLLGRPLYTTYEINEHTDEDTGNPSTRLRIVPASELNKESQFDAVPAAESEDADDGAAQTDQTVDEEAVLIKDNRLTVDDASRQTLSMYEIEDLKKAVTGNGREIIERIMAAHKNLDEKTSFSLAKYTLRKAKKYLRRFTVLPMDVSRLGQYLTSNREASRIMELREESLGLINAWANVHVTPTLPEGLPAGKWLVIDDTGGLLVASIAERLGLLAPIEQDTASTATGTATLSDQNGAKDQDEIDDADEGADEDVDMQDGPVAAENAASESAQDQSQAPRRTHSKRHPFHAAVSENNSIYVLHPASQPNVSILKYFGYSTTHPNPAHPLSRHLLTLSWLQLLAPEQDTAYTEPAKVPHADLEAMKPSKRSAYYRKRRRWIRVKSIVDSARAGDFDGLICATALQPASLLKHLVPLVKGGGHVVMYSPTIEPLEHASDLYSKERKGAFISSLDAWRSINEPNGPAASTAASPQSAGDTQPDPAAWKDVRLGTSRLPVGFDYDEADFPVDPRLLLGPTIVTSRARQWQVLPGRTHPMMTSRGGGEGFVFHARRVLPVDGKVEARGKYSKKRKTGPA